MSALGEKDRLSSDEVDRALEVLPAWSLSNEGLKLERTLRFEDFASAFGFMTQAAIVAQTMDHHPEWKNVYNTVEVWLSTHDAGDVVTEKDHKLAQKIDGLVK